MSPNSSQQPSKASFQRQLVAFSLTLIGGLSGVALVAGFALWSLTVPVISGRMAYDTQYLAERMSKELEVTLAAEDEISARELAKDLESDPDFGGVAIFLSNGEVLHGLPTSFAADVKDVLRMPSATPRWGDGRVAAWRPVELEGAMLGSVVVAHSTARLDRLNHWMFGFTGFIALFLIWSTWYAIRFDRRFVAPLRRIIAFARQIGEGQLQTRLDESGATAETQALLDELNRMAGEVQAQHRVLDESRRAALEVSKLKTRFLANMSHEMRTPLNGVIGTTDLLLNSRLDPRVRHDLKVINASATGLMDIIEDVLDISKIEAGRLTIEAIETDLSEVLHTALYAVVVPARMKGLRVRVELEASAPPYLVSDPVRLRQIVLNLLSNAVKFTEQGQVLLRVRVDEGRLEISVRDTGIGMTTDQLNTVFEAFRQADVSTTRKFGGTGLGLAISRNLVELLGGKLRVDSVPGEGSTFSLQVPLRPASVLVSAEARTLRCAVLGPQSWAQSIAARIKMAGAKVCSPEEANTLIVCAETSDEVAELKGTVDAIRDPGMRVVGVVQPDQVGEYCPLTDLGLDALLSEPAFGQDIVARRAATDDVDVVEPQTDDAGLAVLVAEDNVVNQRVVERMLQQLGHRTTVVPNGQDAVQAVVFDDVKYDVVLMDLQMPQMDGYEATRQIRAAGRGLPIVALTADAMTDAMANCAAVGMDGYLSKPLRIVNLKKELQRVLTASGR